MKFQYNDGGRFAAGYKGHTGDCVTRSIAIASGLPYQKVYDDLFNGINEFKQGRSRAAKRAARGKGLRGTTPRNGVNKKVYHPYLLSLGFKWIPCMSIGIGCKVHLIDGELPNGRLIARVSKHLCAVIDGVINDTHNPDRNGSEMGYKDGIQYRKITGRCVYGYYIKTN